jgi:hypothetical protein
MPVSRLALVAGLLVVCLLAAGCDWQALPQSTQEASGEEPQISPLVQQSPLATAQSEPPAAPNAAVVATETWPQDDAALTMVILHTNDNWGETEPCG